MTNDESILIAAVAALYRTAEPPIPKVVGRCWSCEKLEVDTPSGLVCLTDKAYKELIDAIIINRRKQ